MSKDEPQDGKVAEALNISSTKEVIPEQTGVLPLNAVIHQPVRVVTLPQEYPGLEYLGVLDRLFVENRGNVPSYTPVHPCID